MSSISASRRAYIQARITKKQEQLDALDIAYDDISNAIQEYRFDSGEGKQNVLYKKLKDIADQIDRLEAQISSLTRKLAGFGLVNLNLRRKNYPRYFGTGGNLG